jgi:hypothetical protein
VAGIEQYFDDLRDDGRLDSSGVFTLDPQKVEWKLAQYRLASPKLYPLFLLKAACVVGASGLKSDIDKEFLSSNVGVELTISGLSFSEVELKKATFGQGETREEIRYAVVALTAARALGAVEILGPEIRLTVVGEESTFVSSEQSAARTRFSLTGDSLDDPAKILRERGRWSPVPLSCLPRERQRAVVDSDCPAGTLAVCIGPEYSDGLKTTHRWGKYRSDNPALVMLAWSDQAESRSLGVHRGVSYELDLDLPDGFQIVVRCDDLDLDLSYSNFIQNDAFEKKKKQASVCVSELLEMVLNSEPTLAGEEVEEMTAVIKACWRQDSCTEALKRFYERAVLDHFPLHPLGIESMLERLTGFELDHQVDLYLRRYRREIIETRTFYVMTSVEWVMEEIEFRRNAGRDYHEADTVLRLLEYLFVKKDVHWNQWRIHPFLSRLEAYLELEVLSPDEIEPLGKVHSSWFELLKLCANQADITEFAPIRFLRYLELGQLEKAWSLAEACPASSFVPFRRIWFQLILDFYRGQLSWLQYIQLRAKASFADEAEQRILIRTRYMEPASAFEDWAVYHGVFDDGFWFLAVYFTCFQRKHGRSTHRFWCKILLQAAIGYPGENGFIEENLSRPLRLPLRLER